MTHIPTYKFRKKKQNKLVAMFWIFLIDFQPVEYLKHFFTKTKFRVLIIGLVCLSSAFIFSKQANAGTIVSLTGGTDYIDAYGLQYHGLQGYTNAISYEGIKSRYNINGSNYRYRVVLQCRTDTFSGVTKTSDVALNSVSNCPGWTDATSDDHQMFNYTQALTFTFPSTVYLQSSNYYLFIWKQVNPNPSYPQEQTLAFLGNAGLHNSPDAGLINYNAGNLHVELDGEPNFSIDSLTPPSIIDIVSPANNATTTTGALGIYVNVQNFNRFVISASLHNETPNIIFDTGYNSFNSATSTYLLTPTFVAGYYDLIFTTVSSNGSTDVVYNFTSTLPAPTCTSWHFNDWSSCIYGSQSREIVESFPADCVGGDPILWRSCDEAGNPYAYGDLYFHTPYSCTTNMSCVLQYDYKSDVFNHSDYIEIFNSSSTLVSSSTIIDENNPKKQSGSSYFVMGSASSTVSNYTVVGHKGSETTTPYDIVVNFPPQPSLPALLEMYAEATLCDDLNLTTNAFGWPNSFGDTMQCFGKKVIRWSFNPDENAVNDLATSYNDFKLAFPFSVFFGITDAVTSGINTQTLTQDDNISVPMIRKTATSTEYYMIPVITSSTPGRAIGQSNYLLIRNTISWFMWIAVAVLLFFQFKKI
jgi:hypothetical protein